MSQEVLSAAVLSGALMIGLLAGLPLGHLARNFHHATPPTDVKLPENK